MVVTVTVTVIVSKTQCVDMATSICSRNSTVQIICTLVVEISKIQECRADIVRAANINILDPQNLVKDCLSDVGFPPFFTKHKTMLVRFKRTMDILLGNNPPRKA